MATTCATWSGPPAREFAWQIRRPSWAVLATAGAERPALRELLALQASDWAFLHSYGWAAEYPRERADGHAAAAAHGAAGRAGEQSLRNLAPQLAGWEARRRRDPRPRRARRLRTSGTSAARSRIRITPRRHPADDRVVGMSWVTTELVPITQLSPTVRRAARRRRSPSRRCARCSRPACRCPAHGSGARPRPRRDRSRSASRGRR